MVRLPAAEPLHLGVVDDLGRGVPDARVEVYAPDAAPPRVTAGEGDDPWAFGAQGPTALEGRAWTGPDGGVRVPRLGPGPHRVRVAPGRAYAEPSPFTVPDGPGLHLLRVQRAVAVRLHVQAPDGSPLAGVHLRALPPGAQDGPRADTGQDGTAVLDGLDVTQVYEHLLLYPPRGRDDLAVTVVRAWRPARGVLRLAPGWSVHLTLRDEHGEPAAGAVVTVRRDPALGPWSETADAAGGVHLAGLPPGPADVHLSWFHGGTSTLGTDVRLVPGVAHAEARLARGRTLRVRLAQAAGGAGGGGVPMAAVHVRHPEGWRLAGHLSALRGDVLVQGLPPAADAWLDLRSRSGGARAARASGLLPADQAEVTLRYASRRLEGRLRGVPEGTPVRLRLTAGPAEVAQGELRRGRFRFEGLPEGEVVLEGEAHLPDGSWRRGTLVHAGDAPADLVLR